MFGSQNVVVMMADQHRADVIGCAGDDRVITPRLDSLAAEGVRYTRVNCQGPLCMPSRASFLTERYVRDHGVFENRSEVDTETPTFLQALREAGYHTACIGKMHLWTYGGHGRTSAYEMESRMRDYGFDEVYEAVGKIATVDYLTDYTEYLGSRGLLDAYANHVRPHNYFSDGSVAAQLDRMPIWDTTPMPIPIEDYADVWIGSRAARWIEEYDREKPFFLWVGFPGPHEPWDAPKGAVALYDRIEMVPPKTLRRPKVPDGTPFGNFLRAFMQHSDSDRLTVDRILKVKRAYYANVTMIDLAVGQMVDALSAKGRLDQTWLIYTADHGEMLGDHGFLTKMVFYDAAVRVPLIVRPPGGCKSQAVDSLVEQIDVPATVRSIAEAPSVEGSEGRTLPILGGHAPERVVSISENYGFASFETDNVKLVLHEDDLLPVQFFDRHEDPLEDENLCKVSAKQPDIAEFMDMYVRSFYSHPVCRPHEPTFG